MRLCSSYRTITLIPPASKILLRIIQDLLATYIAKEISEERAGFRKGRGTRDQIANKMDPRRNNGIWQNNNYVLHRLQQSLRLRGSQSTVKRIKEHGSARTPYSPYKKPVCESRNLSKNGIWRHRVV